MGFTCACVRERDIERESERERERASERERERERARERESERESEREREKVYLPGWAGHGDGGAEREGCNHPENS